MHRHLTYAIALAVAFGVVLGHVAAETNNIDDAVSGRLGGTLQSFTERFGDPLGVNEAAGAVFSADGFGRVFGTARMETAFGPEKRADAQLVRAQ